MEAALGVQEADVVVDVKGTAQILLYRLCAESVAETAISFY
jgi:hypothetical protein